MTPLQILFFAFVLGLHLTACPTTSLGQETDQVKFASLFNGKDLTGWDGDPRFWRVEDGAIVGETTKENSAEQNTFLIYRGEEFSDFELRLKYQVEGYNSGVQYRSVDEGNWVVSGYQCDFEAQWHPPKDDPQAPNIDRFSGMFFEEKGRMFLAQRGEAVIVRGNPKNQKKPVIEQIATLGDPTELESHIKRDDWNELIVIARGNQFVHIINGHVMAMGIDEDKAKRRARGIFAFQLHQGPPMRIRVKDLRVRKLGEEKIAVSVEQGNASVETKRSLQEYAQYALLHRGDPGRGRQLVSDPRIQCTVCHQIDGQGGEVGVDLSAIGGKFDRPHLIESLLEPSKQIVEGYRTVSVLTVNNKIVTGILKSQSEDSIVLVDAKSKRHVIKTANVELIQRRPESLMPTGLASQLSLEEFTDLVAYLESLRSGVKEKMGSGIRGPVSLPDGFALETVVTGLDGATALEVLPDGRILICEQVGQVRMIEDGKLLKEPVVTLPVDSHWERGVIGVTVDPAFPQQPHIYVCWVAKEPYPHHRVTRFTLRGNQVVQGSGKDLLVGDDQTKMGGKVPAGHQGGALHFGPDGKLYIGIGEQTAGIPSQRLDTFLGKILRINSDGSIPADNPFLEQTTGKYQAIWARGCRNPFTFAFDTDGRMLINDVGGKSEEINVGRAGANYGWPVVEHGNLPEYDSDQYDGPIHIYPQSSINGGDFCQAQWPTPWNGKYFFADFVHGWIKTMDPADPSEAQTFAAGIRRPVDLRFGPDGSLFVLLRNAWVVDDKFEGGTGSLLRIRPRPDVASAQDEASDMQRIQALPQGEVVVTEDSSDESAGGLPAFKIETPAATYFLEKSGGGLSSLIDADGKDWLGFHPEKGSGAGGEFRGFPNAVYKQGGSFFHALNAHVDRTKTWIEHKEQGYVSILAESQDGHWQGRYEFFATHCDFTMTKVPKGKRYWILYEGTPGGSLDMTDWWMTSGTQEPQPISKPHEGDIPAPEWIAFGDQGGQRSILLLHHEDDDFPDTFYQMQEKMTVFGFGRKRLDAFHTSIGQRFSIGLVASQDRADINAMAQHMLATVALEPRDSKLSGSSDALMDSSEREHTESLNIELWYGENQRFGHRGNPQRWINVLGRLTGHSAKTTLEFSLNGADRQQLGLGPNRTRLANPGDFNVEIDRSELRVGDNSLELIARDGPREVSRTVTIEYAGPQQVSLPVYVDWSKAKEIQDVAQITDGLWELTEEGIRTVEPYYDRAFAVLDQAAKEYEVTVPVTFHGMRKPGPNDGGRNVVHAAIAVRWPGHADGGQTTQPRVPWYPLGATAEFMIQDHPQFCRWRILGGRTQQVQSPNSRKITFGTRYMMKHRVENTDPHHTKYSVKFWEADAEEPNTWDLVNVEKDDVPSGGVLILAHYADVTFGNVLIEPISDLEGPEPTEAVLEPTDAVLEPTPCAGPQPGEVFREYTLHNGGNLDWRVTDPRATASGAQDFLPNPQLLLDVEDLQHAVRAEVVLDRWGGHAGTKDKRIRFNDHGWIRLPELTTTPHGHPPERYHSQDNPTFEVPLEHLVEGANKIEGSIGPENETKWGQWGLYSVILRIYYDPRLKPDFARGQITSPKSGAKLSDNPRIEFVADDGAKQVDFFAWYDGYDVDGDGVYQEWHESYFQPLRGQPAVLSQHVGAALPQDESIKWNTFWIPDQAPNSIKLVARVRHENGLVFVSDIVDRLSLDRSHFSVRQFRASEVPEAFSVRVGQSKSCQFHIPEDVQLQWATRAILHYRTWEADDRHHDPFELNGHEYPHQGKNHHFDYDLLPIDPSHLQIGRNTFSISSQTQHHMLEVLWPGPAVTIRFRKLP